MSRRRIRLVVVAVLPLALLACGDDDDPVAEAAPGTVIVSDNEFAPEGIEVAVGDTVTWRFEGSAVHNVTSADDAFPASENLRDGTHEQTFDEAGTFEYTCTLHPGMDGSVEVTE